MSVVALSPLATPLDAVRLLDLLQLYGDTHHFSSIAGARQIATGYSIAKDTGAKIFVTSMCIGSGMGMAGVFVKEQ